MTLTGSHNVDKYILPQFLNIKTITAFIGSCTYLKNIINNRATFEQCDISATHIFKICKNDNHRCLKLLLKCIPDINKVGYVDDSQYYGATLLHHMCEFQYIECIKILITSGATTFDIRTRCGISLLGIACGMHFTKLEELIKLKKIIEILLEFCGRDVNIADHYGATPIFHLRRRLVDFHWDDSIKCLINECIQLLEKYIKSNERW
jgi:hypothetical protein